MGIFATLALVLVAPYTAYAQCPTATVTAIPEFDGRGTIRVTSNQTGTQKYYLAGSECTAISGPWTIDGSSYDITNVPSGTYGGIVDKDGCVSACAGPVVLANGSPPDILSPANHGNGVSTSPTLAINITHPNGTPTNITFYGRAIGDTSNDFTLVDLPDTQWYSYEFSATFSAQTQWVVNNSNTLNIAYVAHVGDIVQSHGTVAAEWQVADTAFRILENAVSLPKYPNGIPYGLSVGNHDANPGWSATPSATANYNAWFGVSRFSGRSYYGGHYGSDNDNHYDLFSAGGMNFIVIHIECITGLSSTSPTVLWARDLLDEYDGSPKEYRRAIVVAHYLINPDTTWSTYGNAIYGALKSRSNFFLMLSGHHLPEATKTATYDGNTVYALMANWQDTPTQGGRPNGGDGFLRVMRFTPTRNLIAVHTYSPTLDEYDTSTTNQFHLSYNMGGTAPPSFSVINTVNNVASGSNASISWPGRANGTTYEWYVVASDGNQTMRSPFWRFTTLTSSLPPGTPTDATATPSTICAGNSSTLTASSDAGTVIDWYTGSCGGTLVYTGSPYVASPSSTTTYSARARNTTTGLVSPGCDSVTVTVSPVPTATVTAIPGPALGKVRVSSSLSGNQTFFLRNSGCGAISSWTGSATYHDFTDLQNGTYRGQVQKDICLSACSSPVTLTNDPPFPDFDRDGDVDQEDFGQFQACLTGSGVTQADPACANAKLDADQDVDVADFVIFLGCMAGPNNPPGC